MATMRPVMQRNTKPPLAAQEGASSSATRAKTTCNPKRTSEAYSLRTSTVWVKAQRRKVKKSFLKERSDWIPWIAGAVPHCESKCFKQLSRDLPLHATGYAVESVNGQLSKQIMVKTCPHNVTGR